MFRLIARLDIKGQNLVKSISFEGLRVIGDPSEYAKRYYEQGADELLYIDTVASLYGRNQLAKVIEQTADEALIPITVGGGIASVEDATRLFNAGADKIAINTAAIKESALIGRLASRFGSQAVTVSIEAKRTAEGWEAYTDNGRERTGRDAIAWAHEAIDRGAGELLLTSVDMEGTRKGLEIGLLQALGWVSVPVVISGGCGSPAHVEAAIKAGADAVAVAAALHYNDYSVAELCNGHGRNSPT